MMTLEGYYSADTLNPLLEKGEITILEYIYHHSEKMKQDYENFCKERSLQQDEGSASVFLDRILRQEEEAHADALD